MAGLSAEMIALALGSGLAMAVAVLWLTGRADRGRARVNGRPAGQGDVVPCVFLFDETMLVDVSPSARRLMAPDHRAARCDWARLVDLLDLRFEGLPESPDDLPQGRRVFSPEDDQDPGALLVTCSGTVTRLELTGDPLTGMDGADLHRYRSARLDSAAVRQALDHTPNPIWFETRDGRITWANAGYLGLAGSLGHVSESGRGQPFVRIFEPLDTDQNAFILRRDRVSGPGGDRGYWFDLCAVNTGRRRVVFALNVDAVVNAEMAQRTFVQTLTKTFAQLSIGLAIFNRDRQLALFNPALLDLTELPADFLSSRPTIIGFFDRMRDNQMMPEPKNYANWRERVGTLVAAASDGKFHEVWTLPGGRTYRVTGRPHPDGAVAFLFEDITQEVSQTRNFRTELALGYAVLNEIEDAVAVFTADGVLAFSNAGFKTLWGVDPDSAFADTTIADAAAIWRAHCHPDPMLDRIEAGLIGAHSVEAATLVLRDGQSLRSRVRPLAGGARMVSFALTTEAAPLPAVMA